MFEKIAEEDFETDIVVMEEVLEMVEEVVLTQEEVMQARQIFFDHL